MGLFSASKGGYRIFLVKTHLLIQILYNIHKYDNYKQDLNESYKSLFS